MVPSWRLWPDEGGRRSDTAGDGPASLYCANVEADRRWPHLGAHHTVPGRARRRSVRCRRTTRTLDVHLGARSSDPPFDRDQRTLWDYNVTGCGPVTSGADIGCKVFTLRPRRRQADCCQHGRILRIHVGTGRTAPPRQRPRPGQTWIRWFHARRRRKSARGLRSNAILATQHLDRQSAEFVAGADGRGVRSVSVQDFPEALNVGYLP